MRLSIATLPVLLVALLQSHAALAQVWAPPGSYSTDKSISTANSNVQCLREATPRPPTTGSPNEICGFYSLKVPSGHGGATRPYEAVAIYANAVTDDNDVGGLSAYDTGAFDGHITFGPGCVTCRGFGPHGLGIVPPNTNGYLAVGEYEVQNNGGPAADQPLINQSTSKLAFHATSIGDTPATAAFSATATGGKFHMILEATTAEVAGGDCFTCLLSGDSVSSMIAGTYGDGRSVATGSSNVIGAPGTNRLFGAMTGTKGGTAAARWAWGANGNAESPRNAGSDFIVERYDNAGSPIDAPLAIQRSTGVATFADPVVFASIVRPAQTTFANLRRIDPSPAVGDYLVISDAAACSANGAVTAGGGTGHACAVIYNGAADPWIALVSH